MTPQKAKEELEKARKQQLEGNVKGRKAKQLAQYIQYLKGIV